MDNRALLERLSERESLVVDLESLGALTDPLVEEAMARIPRHLFVPDDLKPQAYEDRPLPVGLGQTISAPHMVALMTSALSLKRGDKVLEVGTGVGYQAAILKDVVGPTGAVVTIEFLPELARIARENLAALNLKVEVIVGDGADGHLPLAPYDAIIVTCALPRIPDSLLWQIRDGGHFVAPVGITRCELQAGPVTQGNFKATKMVDCLFVNMQGRLAAERE